MAALGMGPVASQWSSHRPTWAPRLSIVTSPKASYQEIDVLYFLETTLSHRKGTDLPWRILLFDAFLPQMTDRVRRCAWHFRTVICIHGGGATSVAQVNDTDLHAPLKRMYRAMETQDMLEQCRLKGDVVPVTDRSDCVAWL